MYLDAFSACHETEDVISEHRVAAFCHPVVYSLDVSCVDDQNVIVSLLVDDALDLLFRFAGSRNYTLPDLLNHVLYVSDIQLTLSDSCIECIYGLELQFLEHCRHDFILKLHLPVLETASEQFLAVCSFLEFSLTEFLAYLVPGLVGDDKVEPVRRWLLILAGHYFYDISGLQDFCNPDCLAVHTATRALDSQICVYVECKVQYRRSGSQLPQFS